MDSLQGEAASSTAATKDRSIFFLGAATFCFWASLYIYVPVLPVYAQFLGASFTVVGLIVGAYGITQFLLRIPLGVWSDRRGTRRPFIAIGLVAAAAGALGLAMAPNPWLLLVARGLTGVAASAWVVFTVLYASYYPPGQATHAVTRISFVNAISQVAASLAGGYIAQDWGWRPTFLAGVVLAGAGLLFLTQVRERPVVATRPLDASRITRIAMVPTLLLVSGIAILTQFVAFGTTFGFTPIYAANIGASKADLGTMTMLMFAATSLGSWIASPVDRWIGHRWTTVLSIAIFGLSTAVVPMLTTVLAVDASQILSGLGRGVFSPILMGASIEAVSSEERATAMGVFQSLYAIGMFAGPLASGRIADAFGLNSLFYFAGAVALVGLVASLAMASRPLQARPIPAPASTH